MITKPHTIICMVVCGVKILLLPFQIVTVMHVTGLTNENLFVSVAWDKWPIHYFGNLWVIIEFPSCYFRPLKMGKMIDVSRKPCHFMSMTEIISFIAFEGTEFDNVY